MKMRGCFERKAIFRYATEIIPEPEKIEIEGHLFGGEDKYRV